MSSPSKGKGRASDRPIRNPIYDVQPDRSNNAGTGDLSPVVHHGIFCSGVQCRDHPSSIEGIRYACLVCGWNYCDTCVRDDNTNHDVTHLLLVCPTPCAIMARTPTIMTDEYDLDEFDLIDPSSAYFDQDAAQRLQHGGDHSLRFMPQRIQYHQDPGLLARVERGEVRKYTYDEGLWEKNRPLEPSPLDSTALRLLHLQAGEGDDKLRCSFDVVRLNEEPKPEYEVLSCSWHRVVRKERIRNASSNADQVVGGEEACQYALYVSRDQGEDRILDIGVEVYEALKALRKPKESRVIWNEDLCSNKANLNEKWYTNRTIPLIYQSATQMIVWADRERDHVDDAMGLWELILQRSPESLSVSDVKDEEDTAPESDDWHDAWQLLFEIFPKGILDKRADFRNVIFSKEAVFQVGQYSQSWKDAMKIASMLSRPDWVLEYYGR